MDGLFQWMSEYRYALIFFALMGEAVGLPIPAEPVLLVAGALLALGKIEVAFALPLALAGLLAGDTLIFLLGRYVGVGRTEKAVRWYCRWVRCSLGSEYCYNQAREALSRFRASSLLWVKFVVGARMFAPPLAGMSGTRYIRFLVYDGAGSLLWVSCFLGLGYLLNERLPALEEYLRRSGQALIILLVAGFIAVLLFKLYRRRRYGSAFLAVQQSLSEEKLRDRKATGHPLDEVTLRE